MINSLSKGVFGFGRRSNAAWLGGVLCLFILLISNSGRALAESQAAIDVSQLSASIPVSQQVRFFIDHDDRKISDVLESDAPWQFNTESVTNYGQRIEPLWLHFKIKGTHALPVTAFLKLNYNHLDDLKVFYAVDQKILQHFQTGDSKAFDSRAYPSRVFLFPLPRTSDEVDVFVRMQSQGPLIAPLSIVTQSEHDQQEKAEALWNGAYFGILFMMFFYNLFIYLLVRDVTYVYYLFYVFNVAALQATLEGLGFQYVWPQWQGMNNTMTMVFTAMMPLGAILFVRKFLNLRENGKPLEVFLGRALVVTFLALLPLGYFLSYMVALKIIHTVSMLAIVYGFYLGVVFWFRGLRSAKIFAMAWFVYLLFIGVYLLDIQGITQPNLIADHALEIGSLFELVLLSLSFGDKINEEKEKRLQAQEQALEVQTELNKNLDNMVRQRTEELELANQKLKELSFKDPLTGLYNRRYFDELYDIEFKRAFREKSDLCVAMVDIDHFKRLNDTYGHQVGDQCLTKVASALSAQLRRPPDIAARFGGEEFILLLPSTDLDGAAVVAENVRKAIEMILVDTEKEMVSFTASVGVYSAVPTERDEMQEFIKKADENLYKAKTEGRNRVVAN